MLYPQLTPTRCVVSLNGMWELAREHEPGNQHKGFKQKSTSPCRRYNDLYAEEGCMWKDGMWYQRNSWCRGRCKANIRAAVERRGVPSSVFVNGKEVGSHEGGHLPFECEVTDVVEWNKPNLVCVRCENRLSATAVPMGNCATPAERAVRGPVPRRALRLLPLREHQRDVLVHTPNAFLKRPSDDGRGPTIARSVSVPCIVGNAVRKHRRGCVSRQTRKYTSAGGWTHNVGIHTGRPDPQRRAVGRAQPNLYDAEITLFNGTDVVDTYKQRFGIRTIRVTGNRLLLNDKPVYLQGFGRHEDFPIIGRGLCHAANVRDHELLKWVNANSYRTTHYPYSEELVRLADEQGILLIAEAPAVSVNFDHLQDESVRQELWRPRSTESLIAETSMHRR